MSEIPAKISDLGLVRRPLEDDEDAEQCKPLEWGLIRRMFTYARPVQRKLNILLVLTVIRSAQLPALIWVIPSGSRLSRMVALSRVDITRPASCINRRIAQISCNDFCP